MFSRSLILLALVALISLIDAASFTDRHANLNAEDLQVRKTVAPDAKQASAEIIQTNSLASNLDTEKISQIMSQGMNNAIDMLGLSGSPDAKTTPEETLSQLMSGPIGELMSSSLSGAQTDGSASSQVGQLAGSVAWLLLGGSTSTTSSNAKEAKSNSSDSSVAPNKEPVQESSSASDAVGIGRIGTLFLLAITISTIPKFWCAI